MGLGVGVASSPKKLHLGRATGKIGDVELTPEQRDAFERVAGDLAHQVLEPIVNSDQWDATPDLVKRRVYQKAFMQANKAGAIAALPPEMRVPLVQQITQKMQIELTK